MLYYSNLSVLDMHSELSGEVMTCAIKPGHEAFTALVTKDALQ